VYPWGVKAEAIESFLKAHEEKRDAILHLRTLVRQATLQNLNEDLERVKKYPALDLLHPQFRHDVENLIAQQERGRQVLPVFTQFHIRLPMQRR
jgi:hypothetical protein